MKNIEHWYNMGAKKNITQPNRVYTAQDVIQALQSNNLNAIPSMLKDAKVEMKKNIEQQLSTQWDMFKLYIESSEPAFKDWKRWIESIFRNDYESQTKVKALFFQAFQVGYSQVLLTQDSEYRIPVYDSPTLNEAGVETVKVLSENEIEQCIDDFKAAERGFPEFTQYANVFVLGGFAAYGNPSSFHNSLVKHLRRMALDAALRNKLFARFLQHFDPSNKQWYGIELLFDRMMHRWPKQSPMEETAHRDVTPAKLVQQGDVVFGGWINLTKKSQYFVAWPGSHMKQNGNAYTTMEVAITHEGFSSLDATSREYMQFQCYKRAFQVPPGHMVVFPQHIIHEVLSDFKTDHDSDSNRVANEQFRLFTGWRLTQSNMPMDQQSKERAIDLLETPKLPSDQLPGLFGKNHRSLFMNKSFRWIGDDNGPQGSVRDWWNANIKEEIRMKQNALHNANPKKVKDVVPHLDALTSYPWIDPHILQSYLYSDQDKDLMMRVHPLEF